MAVSRGSLFSGSQVFSGLLRDLVASPERPGPVLSAMDRVEGSRRADPLIPPLRGAVRAMPAGFRDALHGTWLGHPAHPAMVQIPIGTWMSAAVLDLLPGRRRAAGLLVAAGLTAAAPAALAGLADWAELRKPQMRVGLVHAATNVAAVAMYTASLSARLRGRRMAGRGWGYAGLATVSLGGALGGHLAYRQAAGANHADQVAAALEPGWHPLGALDDFPIGTPATATVLDVPVLVFRETADTLRVLADRCNHMGGPLSEGEVAEGCVRCPWHGSTFRLTDGWNVTGPATAPQPAFEARVVDGRVEVRLPAEDKET
ncbi:Rieske 2Fe-2S domain-containing protein [Streptomyces millisiae]|uniref:Rieske 2Fe-2S domain-containing protein n=1 Tax=Streptomyces millisiae TaxID=3075542 RepID=A0ABU2LQU4_9ACTN|nr:Rieske 2Fe-2S domain-containing protein [Streptomyces sp. DSM 44918]MDT0319956.1 Rieske 2Fe-2S domain-containing protein [Streptomyces sp. DSM 44918]